MKLKSEFAMKSANYKSHQNILVFYNQWKIMSDLNMSHEEMSDFVLFPLFGFTLVIKLRNFDIESHWNAWIFFDKKRHGVRFMLDLFVRVCRKEKSGVFFISIVWVQISHKTEI